MGDERRERVVSDKPFFSAERKLRVWAFFFSKTPPAPSLFGTSSSRWRFGSKNSSDAINVSLPSNALYRRFFDPIFTFAFLFVRSTVTRVLLCTRAPPFNGQFATTGGRRFFSRQQWTEKRTSSHVPCARVCVGENISREKTEFAIRARCARVPRTTQYTLLFMLNNTGHLYIYIYTGVSRILQFFNVISLVKFRYIYARVYSIFLRNSSGTFDTRVRAPINN